jgi:hypothetical protein
MAITIPNRQLIKPTIPGRPIPGVAKVGQVNPYPVRVATTGAASAGNPLCERATARVGYLGYNVRPDVPVGASADDEGFAILRGCIVEGFAGVLPGIDVYIDAAATPVPEGTFSGLTQTVPAGGVAERIGTGVTTTKIYFD